MRRLFLPFALAVATALSAAAPASSALARTGSQSFSLRDGSGIAVVWQRGALLGHMRSGRLIVVDLPPPGSPTVIVRGHETKKVLNDATTEYRGRDMSFRIFGGTWRARIRGQGIDVSGVVRGWLRLSGVSGSYAIGDGDYEPWPATPQVFRLAT
ncbi:MAG: hypothetical protein WD428_02795 [Gaiellaceae bacterium]